MALVEFEKSGAVGLIRMNRPKWNQMSAALAADLSTAVDAAAAPDVRAVVVHGSPNFCAGADIAEFIESQEAGKPTTLHRELGAIHRRIELLPKPVVAAVVGFALGGGCELALACDLRIFGEGARIGQPEILLGLLPGAGGTQRLTRLVGPAKAKDIIFTGRQVGAEEAARIGLADQMVADDEVLDVALGVAGRYATGPTVAFGAAKAAIHRAFEGDVDGGFGFEADQFDVAFASEDAREGCRSFKDEGPGKATFTGA
jgi:enoyl-CoA hydratase/carnithine racemase